MDILSLLTQAPQYGQQQQMPPMQSMMPAQQPNGLVQQILSSRFQQEPTAQDVGNAALSGISNNSYVAPEQFSNARQDQWTKQISNIAAMQKTLNGGESPSAVREYQYYNSLPPAEQENFLRVKRAQQVLNLGGSMATLSPTDGSIATNFPKTVPPQDTPAIKGAQKTAEKQAEITTQGQADLPRIADQGQTAVNQIETALKMPGLDSNFGMTGMIPNRPGSEAADAKTFLDQIKGGGFLTAYGQLRGGGSITEVEGEKATTAYARMQTAQSAQAFRQAAKDYVDVIKLGVKRAKNTASGAVFNGNPAPSATANTATKTIGGVNYMQDENGDWYQQ